MGMVFKNDRPLKRTLRSRKYEVTEHFTYGVLFGVLSLNANRLLTYNELKSLDANEKGKSLRCN